MRLALDTNRYTDFRRGMPGVARVLEEAEAVYLPLPVLAELRVGFVGGTRLAANERELEQFLSRPGVNLLVPDADTTIHYATVFRQLRQQGTPIPTNDIWIAALVLQHGLTLYARDRHFDHLPQIPRA